MKIKEIAIRNNQILGDLDFSFVDSNGDIYNNIVIAGENGAGKSTLLNVIYEFSVLNYNSNRTTETRLFKCQLSNEEINTLNGIENFPSFRTDGVRDNEIIFFFDMSITGNWNSVKIQWKSSAGRDMNTDGSIIKNNNDARRVFKAIFSDVEINYTPRNINSVTSRDVDTKNYNSEKSDTNLASNITQLLIDVQSLDDSHFAAWARNNPGSVIDNNEIDVKMRRFKESFRDMFDTKYLDRIENESDRKRVIFKENGKDIDIEYLSSGEKQIVFRGSFLLKDQGENVGSLIIIDEPEISLHPKWQLKILDFYISLFRDDTNTQTSQIIFVTHSEYVLKSALNRLDTLVINMTKEPTTSNISARTINGPFYLPQMTSAEISFIVFGVYNVDYHIQLYNYIPTKYGMSSTYVKDIDLKIESLPQYNSATYGKVSRNSTTVYNTLSTFIRNQIHHNTPTTFTDEELKKSIDFLISIIM